MSRRLKKESPKRGTATKIKVPVTLPPRAAMMKRRVDRDVAHKESKLRAKEQAAVKAAAIDTIMKTVYNYDGGTLKLPGAGSDMKRITELENILLPELKHFVVGSSEGIVLPGSLVVGAITSRLNENVFEPNLQVSASGRIGNKVQIEKIELHGWPFGLPSIQGCDFWLLQVRNGQLVDNQFIRDSMPSVLPYNADLTQNPLSLSFSETSGYGAFWDPTIFKVLMHVPSLSREPVYQGVHETLHFDPPIEVLFKDQTYDLDGNSLNSVLQNSIYAVHRNGGVVNMVNLRMNIRVWYRDG
jgi:hypothetical protein